MEDVDLVTDYCYTDLMSGEGFGSKANKLLQSGQALVLILLSLAVVLTLVLFVLARSTTDIAVSSRQEESVRAFSAAEAGVEKSLIVGAGFSEQGTGVGNAGASYTAAATDFAIGSTGFAYPIDLSAGEVGTVWFVGHKSDGTTECTAGNPCFTGQTLDLCWGKPDTDGNGAEAPAVELSVYYDATPGDPTSVKIARAALDPNSSRRGSNSFDAPDSGTCEVGGETFAFHKLIDLSTIIPGGAYSSENGLQFAHVRFLYNTTTLHSFGVRADYAGDTLLPSQGIMIDSAGSAGDSNRRLNVFQAWPEAPSVFQYSIYSAGGLTK